MRSLVAGGAGFIGSHLCSSLLEKGNTVICVDNLITGSKKNIEKLLDNNRFTFIEHDITNQFNNATIQQIGTVDYIYHLASSASPIQYQNHPLETLHVNSIGTEHMLTLAKETGAKILYASTSEVYGDPLEHPQKENYWGNVNSFGPRSCYDESKRFGEALVYTYIKKFTVDARIIRIFNTYGPNMEKNDGRVISNFINQALSDKPITLYGNGLQTRSFCYIADMVEGIIRAMETENTKGAVINLGNPDERSVRDIALLVKQMTRSKSDIVYQDLPEDDPARRQPDISNAKQLLNWKPSISLEEGLEKTIQYFSNL